jgi:hypothetical protein
VNGRLREGREILVKNAVTYFNVLTIQGKQILGVVLTPQVLKKP